MAVTQMLMGVGNGLFQSPSNMGVLSEVSGKNLGVAGGILALARNTGMIMGVAIAINIFEVFTNHLGTKYPESPFQYAYQHTVLILALFAIACTIFAYIAYKDERNLKITI